MTAKQRNELEIWKYFIPSNCDWAIENEEDIKKFFEWSEKGKHKMEVLIPAFKKEGRTYFHALCWGKKWAMIHAHEIYEPAVLSGEYCGYSSFISKDTPRPVVDFLKREMFCGVDANLIENHYQSLWLLTQ